MDVYFNDFKDKKDLMEQFEIDENKLAGVEILFASYGGGYYDGFAFVLFSKDGKLYEVNGSHCSCYGLEGQWSPEEVVIEELLHRIKKGMLWHGFAENLINCLKKLGFWV